MLNLAHEIHSVSRGYPQWVEPQRDVRAKLRLGWPLPDALPDPRPVSCGPEGLVAGPPDAAANTRIETTRNTLLVHGG